MRCVTNVRSAVFLSDQNKPRACLKTAQLSISKVLGRKRRGSTSPIIKPLLKLIKLSAEYLSNNSFGNRV